VHLRTGSHGRAGPRAGVHRRRGNKAYVTLQENNALAIIDIADAFVERIIGLGRKDHSVAGNKLDTSDRDGSINDGINITNWPIHGLYQPDAIEAFSAKGRTFLIMANEGDAREYDGYEEAVRLGSADYVLDPDVFPNGLTPSSRLRRSGGSTSRPRAATPMATACSSASTSSPPARSRCATTVDGSCGTAARCSSASPKR
jgi:hypothetical protein